MRIQPTQKMRLAWRFARAAHPTDNICEICGSERYPQRHHDDYSKLAAIRFLCQKHHRQFHEDLKRRTGSSRAKNPDWISEKEKAYYATMLKSVGETDRFIERYRAKTPEEIQAKESKELARQVAAKQEREKQERIERQRKLSRNIYTSRFPDGGIESNNLGIAADGSPEFVFKESDWKIGKTKNSRSFEELVSEFEKTLR